VLRLPVPADRQDPVWRRQHDHAYRVGRHRVQRRGKSCLGTPLPAIMPPCQMSNPGRPRSRTSSRRCHSSRPSSSARRNSTRASTRAAGPTTGAERARSASRAKPTS
jgi:hypothetical protein